MRVFVNGKLYDKNHAKISVFDRSLQYGDGVFETIRAYHGVPFRLADHIERLYKSASTLGIKIPIDKSKAEEAVRKTLASNDLREAYVKILITGGINMHQKLASRSKPNIIVFAGKLTPFPQDFSNGVRAIIFDGERFLPSAKSCNMLLSILAKQEAESHGAFEAFFVDRRGHITEGTVSNIFVVKRKAVYTPKDGFLAGITRDTVMKIIQATYPLIETDITRESLYEADESFLTSTIHEVVPVTNIDGYEIGDGKIGKVTLNIREQYRATARSAAEP